MTWTWNWIDDLAALVLGLGVVLGLVWSASFLAVLIFPRAPRPAEEVLAEAFEGRPLVYVPDLIRSGELGPPARALATLRELLARRVIFARAMRESDVAAPDRALCLPGPRGTLVALAYREEPMDSELERLTPTEISASPPVSAPPVSIRRAS